MKLSQNLYYILQYIKMELFRYQTKEEARGKAVEELNKLFSEIQGPILFLSSGGSSFEVLEEIEIGYLAGRVTLGMLDERYGVDPKVNNFFQLFQTQFFQKAKKQGISYIDTSIQKGESLEQLAKRFEKFLGRWKEKNPPGKVIITQGVGSDGHTAGIMPYPKNPELFKKLFDTPGRWVAGYNARVTVTLSFLRHIVDYSLVYLVGEQKREALRKVLAPQGTLW